MTEIKPVYQAKICDDGNFAQITEAHYQEIADIESIEKRILYPAAAYEALSGKYHELKARSEIDARTVEALQKENAELKEINDSLHHSSKFTYENQKTEIESLRKQVEILESKESIAIQHLTQVVEEMNHLMNDSKGVAGLPILVQIAPWDSLLRGGEFGEWLSYLSDAAEYVQSKNGE